MNSHPSGLALAFVFACASACVESHDVSDEHDLHASASGRDGGVAQLRDGGSVAPLRFADIGKPAALMGDYKFPEGPVWSPSEGALYFADINGDAIYRMKQPDQAEKLFAPAQHPDGLALDPEGKLVVAGFGSRTVWRLDGDQMQTLADQYQGKKLNSPDDLVVRSDGVIYFTDPTFGIDGSQGLPSQTQELDGQGVFRIDAQGDLHMEDSTQGEPNGIALSPDEKTLYVSYTLSSELDAFDVTDDGSLQNKHRFAGSVLAGDSMTVDSQGNLYVATLGGIAVFSPNGTSLGTIAVPQSTSNLSFGGADQRTLFITARDFLVVLGAGKGTLYQIEGMPVPGIPGRP